MNQHTDSTNPCIVGGLIGAAAAVGVELPQVMRDAVLNCDTSKGQHPRPRWLHPQQVLTLINSLVSDK